MTPADKPALTSILQTPSASRPGPVQPDTYSSSQVVREFLVLKALSSSTGRLPGDLQQAHDSAFANVCEGIRAGSIVLDYEPEESGCVDMPPVHHPLYMQSLMYWCVEMRCTLPRLVEAHARIGQFASRSMLQEALAAVEKEDRMPSTSFQSTNKWRDAPSTIPLGGR